MNIIWLDDPVSTNAAQVGGKAAHLGRLAGRHNVPPGFTLTTSAFAARAAAGPALWHDVAAAYQQLCQRAGAEQVSVAVRSSAVGEDGLTLSFAGLHATYLNVVGYPALVAAIERCWESAASQAALAYRRQQGLKAEHGRMAVLVQQLVTADTAAVVFSANPATGQRGEVVINASWGLGESVVGGTTTPDTFTVRAADLTLTDRRLGDKARMTVLADGGVREVDTPRWLRARPSLTDDQARALAALAVRLEQEMGWPVDLECAFQGDRLYLLQCRPITGLAPQ